MTAGQEQRERWLDGLAELAVFAANVQEGQSWPSRASSARRTQTRKVVRAAYLRGAKYVDVLYFDQWIKRSASSTRPRTHSTSSRPGSGAPELPLRRARGTHHALRPARARVRSRALDPGARRTRPPAVPARTGEVVNARTTNWTIVPAPTRPWAETRVPGARRRRGPRPALGGGRPDLPARHRRPGRGVDERVGELKSNAARLTERRFDAIRLHGPRHGPHRSVCSRRPPGRRATSRRSTAVRHSPEHPDRGALHDTGSRAGRRPRVGDHAARALRDHHRGHSRRVRGRARGEDRRRQGRRRAPHGGREGRGRLTARRARARGRGGPHRPARDASS